MLLNFYNKVDNQEKLVFTRQSAMCEFLCRHRAFHRFSSFFSVCCCIAAVCAGSFGVFVFDFSVFPSSSLSSTVNSVRWVPGDGGSWLNCGDCQPWEHFTVQGPAVIAVEASRLPRHSSSIQLDVVIKSWLLLRLQGFKHYLQILFKLPVWFYSINSPTCFHHVICPFCHFLAACPSSVEHQGTCH